MRFKNLITVLIIAVIVFSCTKNQKENVRFWDGLIGAFYGNADLTNIKDAVVLTSLNNEWNEQTGHGKEWSGQYEGFLIAPVTGTLTVYFQTNKTLNYQLEGTKGKVTEQSGEKSIKIKTNKDGKYYIKIAFLYFEGDPGSFKISWEWEGHKKSVIPNGSFVFNAKQAKKWNWLPEPDPDEIDYSKFIYPKDRHNVTVFYEKGKFAGWPANGGIWIWGNEILVNFIVGYYKEMEHHHSIDDSKPKQSILARSTDGGEHWEIEGEFNVKELKTNKLPRIDFSNPNLAIKVYPKYFIVSLDKGKTWLGNYPLPDFGYKKLTNRTDYVPLGKDKCLFGLSYEDKTVQARLQDKSFTAITRDGGKTFEKLGEHAPNDNVRSVMSSTIELSNGHFLTATRRRYDEHFGDKAPRLPHDWIDLFESLDYGKTWKLLSKVADTDTGKQNGNPPSLVKMKDGKLCITYGYRAQPFGIRAKLSSDNGKTWSKEIHLRDHARKFDMGYTRSVQRPDGKIVTIYYFTTDKKKEMHIDATIWDPDSIEWEK